MHNKILIAFFTVVLLTPFVMKAEAAEISKYLLPGQKIILTGNNGHASVPIDLVKVDNNGLVKSTETKIVGGYEEPVISETEYVIQGTWGMFFSSNVIRQEFWNTGPSVVKFVIKDDTKMVGITMSGGSDSPKIPDSYTVHPPSGSTIYTMTDVVTMEETGYASVDVYWNGIKLKTVDLTKNWTVNLLSPQELEKGIEDGQNRMTLKLTKDDGAKETGEFYYILNYKDLNPDWKDVPDPKVPEPPEKEYDILGWLKYLVDWFLYLVSTVVYFIKNTVTGIGQIVTEGTSLTNALGQFFGFLPTPLVTVLITGISLGIIAGIMRR